MTVPLRQFFAAAIFAALLAFAFQGTRGLWPDETRYSNAAAEMLQSGDYFVSRINHLPFLNKPPLQIWGLAAGMKLLGCNEWGARFFNALCLLATAFAVGWLALIWWGREAGVLAGLIYVSLPGALGAANLVTPDTPLTLWLALALVCFWKSLPGQSRSGPWKVLLGLVLALGALTKGPAALLPTGAMLIFLFLRGQFLRFFFSPWLLAGAVVFLLPVAGWYLPVMQAIPGADRCFWDSQIYGRLFSNIHDRHPGLLDALWIYGPMFAAMLPWLAAPLALWLKGKERCASSNWWRELRQRPVALLLLLWILLPSFILGLATSKLPLYILPVFPAVALLCARAIMRLHRGGRWTFTRRWWALFFCWGLVLLAAKGFSAYWSDDHDARAQWKAIAGHLPPGDFRLVAFGRLNGQGLGFYSGASVVETTGNDPSYLIQEGPLDDQIEEARFSVIPRVFVFKKSQKKIRAAKGLRSPEELLAEAGIKFEKQDLPLDITMLRCQPGADAEPTVRVMLVGAPGGGIIAFNAANALQRLSEDMNLSGIVLPRREFCGEGAEGQAAWAPFPRILNGKVPFYTREGPGWPAKPAICGQDFDKLSRADARVPGLKFGDLLEIFFVEEKAAAQGGEEARRSLATALQACKARFKSVVFECQPEGIAWARMLAAQSVTWTFSLESAGVAPSSGGLQCLKCDKQSLWLLEATAKKFTLRHYDSLGRGLSDF